MPDLPFPRPKRSSRSFGLCVIAGLALSQSACISDWSLGRVNAPTPASQAEGPREMVDRLVAKGMPTRLLVAADIGQCNHDRQPRDAVRATAALIDERPGLVIAAGDLAYPDGRAVDFSECYDPAWGGLRSRTLPAPGNHEYHSVGAPGYFQYFGALAGPAQRGWYSVDFGGWHIISLNSNVPSDEGSAQLAWLRSDLARRPQGCLAAFWHHPRFSSGGHGNNYTMDAPWRLLAEAGADAVFNGHDHDYERFAPQDATGQQVEGGIREFVVGSGGAALTPFLLPKDHSEVRNNSTYGILEVNLRPDGYEWRFLGTDQAEFEDRGSASCHHHPA